MNWVYERVVTESDGVILLGAAAFMASLAVLLAWLSSITIFRTGKGAAGDAEPTTKLAEVVHGSLLAFAIFVLALLLSDVRSNLGKADDAAAREGSLMVRLSRELGTLGSPEATAAREALKRYAASVARDDWRDLGQTAPALAPQTDAALDDLASQIHLATRAHPASASTLKGLLDTLEDHRQGRLESATKSIPPVFWWVMAAFLLGAMVMNGRLRLDAFNASLVAIHMGAVGLVIALILVMDSPFRGGTSVSPAHVQRVVQAP